MNPLRWVRWKLVVVFAVIVGVCYFLGVDPLAKWQINRVGTEHRSARWQVGGVDLGILFGLLRFEGVEVATAERRPDAPEEKKVKDRVMQAQLAEFDLSTYEFLRRRFVVDELRVRAPDVSVVRRPDGSSNLGDLIEEEPAEKPAEPKSARDWVETAIRWAERLKKVYEYLPGPGKKKEAPEDREVAGEERDPYESRALYPFAHRPGVVIRRVAAEGLEISLSEKGSESEEIPPLEEGELEILGLSNHPAAHEKPIEVRLRGNLAGARLALEGILDYRGEEPRFSIEASTGELPVSLIEKLIGPSLPVKLQSGKIRVVAPLTLAGDDRIDLAPLLSFREVRLATKPGEDRVAGVDAGEFVKNFNLATEALGEEPIEIRDLRITGTLREPRFEWGDTVRSLVEQGGRAFARRALGEAKKKLDSELDKQVGKLKGEVEERIGKDPAVEAAGERLKELIPKKEAEGVLEGILGPQKKSP